MAVRLRNGWLWLLGGIAGLCAFWWCWPTVLKPSDPVAHATTLRLTKLVSIATAVELYALDNGRVLAEDGWQQVLTQKYLNAPIVDRWTTPIYYGYSTEKDGYYVWSYGRDDEIGGAGYNQDFFVPVFVDPDD